MLRDMIDLDIYHLSTKKLYNWIDEGKLTIITMDLAMKLRRFISSTKFCKHKKVLEKSNGDRLEFIKIEGNLAIGK